MAPRPQTAKWRPSAQQRGAVLRGASSQSFPRTLFANCGLAVVSAGMLLAQLSPRKCHALCVTPTSTDPLHVNRVSSIAQ